MMQEGIRRVEEGQRDGYERERERER